MPKNYRNQDYIRLRKRCLASRELFQDPEFPANHRSLFFSKDDTSIVWKRPKELCKSPKLIVEGITCDDLVPGELGNSWFVTACASLVQDKIIWQKVFPNHKEQEWDPKNSYVGMFRFNFWRFGEWIEVVVDDRLPTRNNRLIFCHSKSRNEFWSALLEKAYAKLFGDYESLAQGFAVDALVDFTGGVAERLDLSQYDLAHEITSRKIFQKIYAATDNKALIVAEISCSPRDRGTDGERGLVLGQGYTLSGAASVPLSKSLESTLGTNEMRLVRLFNPWEAKEWTGPWSDGMSLFCRSREWKYMPVSEWEKNGVKFRQEGEFWMAFTDFVHYFTSVDICHFVNTSFFTIKKTWNESIWHSQWTTAGMNGGGEYQTSIHLINSGNSTEPATEIPGDFYKRKFIFKFLFNPQYAFDITGQTDHIMVTLEQHDVKGREALLGRMNTVGFHLLKVEANRRYRVHIPWEKMFTSEFSNHRSVFGTARLRRGRYIVLPCTQIPGKVGQFVVRLYTTNSASGRELVDEAPCRPFPCMAAYKCVTSITVIGCQDLMPPPGHKGSK
ncbi:calpain-5-like [Babylonia areolata]|uniref:calpain-5-like n=1 Tax=Babylonia areolata TaxID=304850 RepID=UPI003FD57198